jgi:glycosyltransferase involved in cell wall biosynthesis
VRILVLSNMYPPHHLGGYELSCRDVVDRWRVAGHDVTVLTTDFQVNDAAEPEMTEPVVNRTLEWYWKDHVFLRPSPVARFRLERRNHARLRRVLEAFRPDVVSIWHMGGMSVGLLSHLTRSRVPLVYVVCDDWPTYAAKVDPWALSWSRRPRRARVVSAVTGTPTSAIDISGSGDFCFVSDFLRRKVVDETGWKLASSTVVPSGISTDDFPIAEPAPAGPWSGRLLCVGRVEPRKGFRTAVEALVTLPDASLRIVGPADPRHGAELLDLASTLGVATRLSFDVVPRNRLAEAYRTADVVLFTSAWQEPFGLVPLEAMACAVPVVACATGGAAEFLEDGTNCVVVPPQDCSALAAAIIGLASDPGLRSRLQAGGRATAAALTIDRYATALEARHAQAAGRHGEHTTEGLHSWR